MGKSVCAAISSIVLEFMLEHRQCIYFAQWQVWNENLRRPLGQLFVLRLKVFIAINLPHKAFVDWRADISLLVFEAHDSWLNYQLI
jgi:hypothetical protein